VSTLATISDQSSMTLWGWQGWALAALLLVLAVAVHTRREIVRERAAQRASRLPLRHADKQIRQSA
jgi:hypothetical protein